MQQLPALPECRQPNVAQPPLEPGQKLPALSPVLGFDRRLEFLLQFLSERRFDVGEPVQRRCCLLGFLDGAALGRQVHHQLAEQPVTAHESLAGFGAHADERLQPSRVARLELYVGLSLEVHPHATGAKRLPELIRVNRQQDENRPLRRLFQRLEKGIECGAGHAVGAGDDRHLIASLGWLERYLAREVADLLDADDARFFLRSDKVEVGKVARIDLAAGDAVAARFEWDAGFASRGRGLAVERPRQLGRVRLERLDRAANEQIRVAKSAVGQAAPEQIGGLAGGHLRCVGHGRFIWPALAQGDSGIHF